MKKINPYTKNIFGSITRKCSGNFGVGVKKNRTHPKGFSLVEMILVVAISAIIALSVSQIFLTNIRTFEKNKDMQKNLEEGRSVMELMAKNVRMSNYLTPDGINTVSSIYFYNHSQNKCIEYTFDGDKLKTRSYTPSIIDNEPVGKCVSGTFSGSYSDLTGSGVTGAFYVISTIRTDGSERVGRATIRITMGTGTDIERAYQSTVSFRDYADILQ